MWWIAAAGTEHHGAKSKQTNKQNHHTDAPSSSPRCSAEEESRLLSGEYESPSFQSIRATQRPLQIYFRVQWFRTPGCHSDIGVMGATYKSYIKHSPSFELFRFNGFYDFIQSRLKVAVLTLSNYFKPGLSVHMIWAATAAITCLWGNFNVKNTSTKCATDRLRLCLIPRIPTEVDLAVKE